MSVSVPSLPSEHIGVIDPLKTYTLGAGLITAGIGRSTVGDAKKIGIELKTLAAGRRKWVKGCDLIAFIEALAANYAASKEAK